MTSQRPDRRRGSALVFALLILLVTTSLGSAAVITAIIGRNVVRDDLYGERASCIAESGVEKALVELLRDPAFAGDTGVPFDAGSFSTTVRAISENEWEVTSTGTACRANVPFRRRRIVARVSVDAGRTRVVSWDASSLPVTAAP
ncbi:MAG: hypothetical protein JW889_00220 [Verrucomicrobia bacterium]|nr:hypothetical protein [Verrucomicrobiota bacterium]